MMYCTWCHCKPTTWYLHHANLQILSDDALYMVSCTPCKISSLFYTLPVPLSPVSPHPVTPLPSPSPPPAAEWAALYREATGVWCRVPKLVLVDMYEELNIRRGMEQLFPSCMKVYRCAGSGCCSDERHHCVANESARTNVTWLVSRKTL